MANIKTAISLQETLFEQIEALAAELNISRSRLFALAAEEFIERYHNQKLLAQLNEAYADSPDDAEQDLLQKMRLKQRTFIEGEW